jgi:hypothetical protein
VLSSDNHRDTWNDSGILPYQMETAHSWRHSDYPDTPTKFLLGSRDTNKKRNLGRADKQVGSEKQEKNRIEAVSNRL